VSGRARKKISIVKVLSFFPLLERTGDQIYRFGVLDVSTPLPSRKGANARRKLHRSGKSFQIAALFHELGCGKEGRSPKIGVIDQGLRP